MTSESERKIVEDVLNELVKDYGMTDESNDSTLIEDAIKLSVKKSQLALLEEIEKVVDFAKQHRDIHYRDCCCCPEEILRDLEELKKEAGKV